MGYADLHLHSLYSKDGTCSVETILMQAQARRLDVIAITDHNSMDGVITALLLMRKYQVQVIPAIEISTAEGHLLAYELSEPIQKGLSLDTTVREIYDQGGFCIVPHPMGWERDAIRSQVLANTLRDSVAADTILGIEVINGGLNRRNHRATGLDETFQLAAVGNSDGHNRDAVGRAVTCFEGNTIPALKKALRQRKTTAQWHYRTPDPIFYAEHIGYRILHSLGFGVGILKKNEQPRLWPVRWLKK